MSSPNSQSAEAGLHAVDYWQVIRNRYGIILLAFLLVFMTALVITYVMPKKYESTATLQVRSSAPSLEVLPGIVSRTASAVTQSFLQTEFEVITAQKTLDIVIDELDLTNHWNLDREEVRQSLAGMIDAENIRGTELIKIKVRASNPRDARMIAERVSKAYRLRRAELENKRSDQALAELREAVIAQEDLVEEKRRALTTLIRTERIPYVPTRSGQGQAYNEIDDARVAAQRYAELEAEKVRLESQIETLLRYSGPQLMTYAAGLNLPENVIRTLHPQYLEAQRTLDALKAGGLGENHPNVRQQKEVLDGLWSQLQDGVVALRETLNAQLELSKRQAEGLKKAANEKEDEAVTMGIARQSFDDARADFETAQALLEDLKIKEIGEQMQRRISEDPVIVHEEPVEAQAPVVPNVTLNLALGAIVGLIFGVGIAFLLEYLDTSVKTLEDVERYLQVPVLAVIPKDVGVLYKQSGMSPDAEAYRILRTNIEFNRKNPEDNAITVVSGGAGEGKSTTLVNLAYICAQGGYTTLMIDADLRRPRLHTFFDINNSVGLTNYLTTDLMLEDVILQTPVDNLYFMPSGILPADAAGILNSRRMSELIQDVKQRFDLVLVDSPPILGVSDASVLASEVDLTMIVVQHRKLPRNMLQRVKSTVEGVGGHVIGVVLNNVDVRSDSQYQYYTSYYTYYAPSDSPQPSGGAKPKSVAGSDGSGRSSSSKDQDDLY
ncbi:capsular exopolysaccharide synthesis family protein [Haloferula luteola]|uniref:Capsular exopolysaccharide synthesis family protein n=1 Tax=Haloferula luteola TaxID=595692 RepID=A0A840UX61_9BACT|nr:polysaccharide biosynthesis tyrosine autokinase [Haloferula luteola]MBB5350362.1 capsular exopolysaccharide synthesis family protein [Haloferula luteola]